MRISVFFLLILNSLLAFSGNCPTATTACSNITNQSACGSYYLETGCTENTTTTTTYCFDCNICSKGVHGCVKGTTGCQACKFTSGNGTYTCTGMTCKWGDYCFNGGGNITCTK